MPEAIKQKTSFGGIQTFEWRHVNSLEPPSNSQGIRK